MGVHVSGAYLRTKDDAEIDLIIDRPGLPLALIEIKSAARVGEGDIATLERFHRDIGDCQSYCFSCDPTPCKIRDVTLLPWQQGLVEIGL